MDVPHRLPVQVVHFYAYVKDVKTPVDERVKKKKSVSVINTFAQDFQKKISRIH